MRGLAEREQSAALVADCYEEMRRIARRLLIDPADRLLLQPTELANEAAIRLLAIDADRFESRAHMLATAARVTRHMLIDEARAAKALKRRAPELLTLWPATHEPVPLEKLDEAVKQLERVSPDHARIVELRFFLGLTVEEAAASEGISPRSIKRRWSAARAWLQRYLEEDERG